MKRDGLTRKQVLKLGAAALAAGATGGLAGILRAGEAPAQIKRRRPNILMIVTDQRRASLPAALSLPAEERLAARGITFDAFHVNAVACGPARSVLYTGQHIQHTRVFDNPTTLGGVDLDPARTPTLGQMLKAAGYYTAYKGKWHLSTFGGRRLDDYARALEPFGFDEYQHAADTYGATHGGYQLDPVIAGSGARWLRERASDIAAEKPWFLAVNLINPHDIMFLDATGRQRQTRILPGYISDLRPPPDADPYRDDLGFDLPETFPGDLSSRPEAHRAFVEDTRYVYGDLPHDDVSAWRRYQNYYFNCCRDVDRHIGTVLAALEESGEAENTIVVFTSDHGEMAGAQGLRLKGPLIYRENVQVPLIIAHPDITGGVRTQALACSLDIAPTLLACAGLSEGQVAERFPGLKGFDLSSSLADPGGRGRRALRAGAILLNFSAVYPANPRLKRRYLEGRRAAQAAGTTWTAKFPEDVVQFDIHSFYRGLYDGRYRFARYFRPGDHHSPRDWATLVRRNDLELYDTRTDPLERVNLARRPGRHKRLIQRLNARLNALIAREVGIDDGSHMPGDPGLWRS